MKQNAEILLDVAHNYEALLERIKKEGLKNNEAQLRDFRNQFLYLLTSIHNEIEKEKNAR